MGDCRTIANDTVKSGLESAAAISTIVPIQIAAIGLVPYCTDS